MAIQKDHNNLYKHPFLILLAFLFVAYLPVFLPFFHLKNDLITQNLPARFFIGESLYSETFPWWNPYLNYGTPQYGDMNSGYWNPVLWFIAKFFGYSVWTITLEEMFYVLIGGWGIYTLTQYYKIPQQISIICSLAYMSGGYVVGHLQHFCWITGTAFFPYVLFFFLSSIKRPILKNFISGGLFSFLFISSTHPGLIIGAIYFFIFLIAHFILIAVQNKNPEKIRFIIKASLTYALIAALFSIISIASNIEVLKYITRGSKVSIAETLYHPTTLQSYLSLLFPFAVNKGNFFHTDISMRNMSIGAPLLPGIYFFLRSQNLKKNWVLFSLFLFFVLLAAGGIFKVFAYRFLPYLGHVRLNGEFAYFPYLLLILASAYGLSNAKNNLQKTFQFLKYFFTLSCSLSLAIILITRNSILYGQSINSIKEVIDNLTFWDLLFFSAILQLATSFLLKKYSLSDSFFLRIAVVNLVFICWGCLPYTALSKVPRKEVEEIISTTPKGISIPSQKAIKENIYIDKKYNSIIGSSAFYSKQIGYPTQPPYPVVLKQASSFYEDSSLGKYINSQALLFLSHDTTIISPTLHDNRRIQLTAFSPTFTKLTVQNDTYQYLIFLQNNYPRWKVLLDGKPVDHFTVFKTFIGIKIPYGTHKVEYRFDTNSLKIIVWLNIFILSVSIFLLTRKRIITKVIFTPYT